MIPAARWQTAFGQDVLRDLDARRAQRRHTGCPAAFHGAALGQDLARRRGLGSEGDLPDRVPLAPLAGGPEVDVDEA